MSKKYLVVTRADDNIKQMTDITLPIMREYAEKCGADFKIISEPAPFMTDDNKPHYRIIKVRDFLEEYDRVLLLDADMIINKDCPNIFEVVPEDKIGSIYEDVGSRQPHRRGLIRAIQQRWGDVGWNGGYTNAGTFLVSKQHKDIFLPNEGQYYTGWGSADVHLSYMIHKLGFEVHRLPFQWNHMGMFSEPWNNRANRFDSHIIHYAGGGVFDAGVKNRMEQIKKDYEKIYGTS